MAQDRFILQPSREQGCWVATDRAHGIVITFREHRFNDTQKVTLLGGDHFATEAEALAVSTHLRELGDWLRKNYYDTIFPSVHVKREEMGRSIRELRQRKGMTQGQLAQMAGITQANVANIEAGKYSVGLDVLNKIAFALGVTIFIK